MRCNRNQHVVGKTDDMGGRYYVILNELIDCHLLYHSILHISWKISYTFYICSGPGVEKANTCITEITILIG